MCPELFKTKSSNSSEAVSSKGYTAPNSIYRNFLLKRVYNRFSDTYRLDCTKKIICLHGSYVPEIDLKNKDSGLNEILNFKKKNFFKIQFSDKRP